MNNYFICATDTDAGKTHVCAALLRDLRARGIKAMGYKPIACGDRGDARAMRDAMGEASMSLDLINPIYLRTPSAPAIAAQLERVQISIPELLEHYHKIAQEAECVLVEGAGGWEVPLGEGVSMSDLAVALGLPVILVVNNKLGAVNHTLLTLQAMRARGVQCHGVILNHIAEEWDTASLTNAQLITEYGEVEILAELIHGQDEVDSCALS